MSHVGLGARKLAFGRARSRMVQSRSRASSVLEDFAGNQALGLSLNTKERNRQKFEGNRRSLVPEERLELS